MTKYLRCHTSGKYVTKGTRYEVLSEDYRAYEVRDNDGHIHSFTKENYHEWFTLETESNEAITLLPDESLGGVASGLLREYNEVKRKALVGEQVKVTDDTCDQYTAGNVYEAQEETLGFGEIRIDSYSGGTVHLDAGEYVVLEPSDIIRIDSTRFRMVERKAAVGERIISLKDCDVYYKRGNIGVVTVVNGGKSVSADFSGNGYVYGDGVWFVGDDIGYRVLIPLSNAIPTQTTSQPKPQPKLSTLDPVDQYAENIAVLTTKVTALEQRVTALESARKTEVYADITSQIQQAVSERKLAQVKTDQQIRDEIVARAKADLENVKTPWNISDNPQPLVYSYGSRVVDAEFIVNREKRTVVAILRWRYNGVVQSKGIAKAAPGEVFNVHLGKIIALYRALGLDVPAEYMNVPAPTEVRVGDVIKYEGDNRVVTVISGGADYYSNGDTTYLSTTRQFKHAILDDSRMSDEESEGVNA